MSARHLIKCGYTQLVVGEPLWARARAGPPGEGPVVDLALHDDEAAEGGFMGATTLSFYQAYGLVLRLLTMMKGVEGGGPVPGG